VYYKKDSSDGLVAYTEWKEREKESSLWRLRWREDKELTFESRIEETGSRRGKNVAEMKMVRERDVWKSWRKDPVMAQTGTVRKKENVDKNTKRK
jgi:hypothetical protein